MALEPGNLVLTRGLMSTLNLVSRTLFSPGEVVAVEDPADSLRCARLYPGGRPPSAQPCPPGHSLWRRACRRACAAHHIGTSAPSR